MFFSNSQISIDYDANLQCIRTTWKGFVSGDKYREGWNKVLELAIEKSCNKWLYDQSDQTVSDPKDTKWALNVFFDKAYPTFKGKLNMAIVTSKDTFERIVTAEAIKYVSLFKSGGKAINTKMFDNIEDAEKWLSEQ